MAAGQTLKCSACAHLVEAWDDGNPYFLDATGKKQYRYHPHPERELCTGNDTPVVCLACGAEDVSDSAAPMVHCTHCGARELLPLWELEDRVCPYCRQGVFRVDPTRFMIS